MPFYKYEVSGQTRHGQWFKYRFVHQKPAIDTFNDLQMGYHIRLKIREISISEAVQLQHGGASSQEL